MSNKERNFLLALVGRQLGEAIGTDAVAALAAEVKRLRLESEYGHAKTVVQLKLSAKLDGDIPEIVAAREVLALREAPAATA